MVEADDLSISYSPVNPEKTLIAAILQRALSDLLIKDDDPLPTANERRLVTRADKRDAEMWFYSPSIDPFSFNWCMSQLSMSSSRLLLEVERILAPCPDGQVPHLLPYQIGQRARRRKSWQQAKRDSQKKALKAA